MNTRNITILSLALLVLGAVAAFGQEIHGVRAAIPFEFTIDNETHPAGDYTLTFPVFQNRKLVLLSGPEGKSLQLVGTSVCYPKQGGEQAYLIFRSYGNKQFLTQIWTGRSGLGRELNMSRAEREIVKSAAVKADTKKLMVAAN